MTANKNCSNQGEPKIVLTAFKVYEIVFDKLVLQHFTTKIDQIFDEHLSLQTK